MLREEKVELSTVLNDKSTDVDEELLEENLSTDTEFEILEETKQIQQKYEIIEAPAWSTNQIQDVYCDIGKQTFKRLLHAGPLSALFIIGLTTSILHVSWWPLNSFGSYAHLLLFLFFNHQVIYNLLKAATIGWKPPKEEDEGRLQYCQRCNGFKAPRSHHCSKCERCVMYIRNEENGFFIDSIYLFLAAILALSFSFGVSLAVGFLFVVQLRSVISNKTGIEQYICKFFVKSIEYFLGLKAKYRNGNDSFVYPYDLGWRRNLSEVFNKGGQFAKGNGIWWPTLSCCDQYTFTEEQLIQKKIKAEYYRLHPEARYQNANFCVRNYRRFISPSTNKIVHVFSKFTGFFMRRKSD